MKKLFLIALAAVGMTTAQAQQALEAPSFGDNWSLGIEGGGITPLADGTSFIKDMRGGFGLHLQKMVSPAFGVGVEGAAYVNTSNGASKTAIDRSYVGAYGVVNLMNLFGGYKCDGRVFEIEAQAGAGWGHEYKIGAGKDWNYFATKAGLNFNFNVAENWTISLKPSVSFNMTGTEYNALNVDQTSAAYSRAKAAFNCVAGVTYNFGPGFLLADTKNQGEIDALNAQINQLRADIAACAATVAATEATNAALAAELEACKNRKPEVIEKVSNNLQSVRYIFYKIGSSTITADQQPNVEMVASYLKNHKGSKVVIKGYASQDGNEEFNKKLAAARAESVKTALIKKYGIAADRIQAEGEGIGHMFSENDWNRVSICTLED